MKLTFIILIGIFPILCSAAHPPQHPRVPLCDALAARLLPAECGAPVEHVRRHGVLLPLPRPLMHPVNTLLKLVTVNILLSYIPILVLLPRITYLYFCFSFNSHCRMIFNDKLNGNKMFLFFL